MQFNQRDLINKIFGYPIRRRRGRHPCVRFHWYDYCLRFVAKTSPVAGQLLLRKLRPHPIEHVGFKLKARTSTFRVQLYRLSYLAPQEKQWLIIDIFSISFEHWKLRIIPILHQCASMQYEFWLSVSNRSGRSFIKLQYQALKLYLPDRKTTSVLIYSKVMLFSDAHT